MTTVHWWLFVSLWPSNLVEYNLAFKNDTFLRTGLLLPESSTTTTPDLEKEITVLKLKNLLSLELLL
jgi:hypothetical protein